jgi:hypothetical protein
MPAYKSGPASETASSIKVALKIDHILNGITMYL